ncbi:MAG TPA: YqgE/AlgH family protein [Bryobacteraceae bacterium]|nr:YqgE/AlgH family protein [Bryobacteraceae bacterium]
MWGLRFLAVALALQAGIRPAAGQSTRPADLGPGKLLVAARDLPDPNFAKTVVLLVQYDRDGVVGLIVNRRSKVPISSVLDNVAGAKKRSDTVYAGGPVSQTDVLALLRSRKQPGEAARVLADVFLLTGKEDLEQAFASAVEPERMHVYAGYAGWTQPQLENELDSGAWFIFPGSAASVFDADPDSLWSRLIRETEIDVARVAFPRAR